CGWQARFLEYNYAHARSRRACWGFNTVENRVATASLQTGGRVLDHDRVVAARSQFKQPSPSVMPRWKAVRVPVSAPPILRTWSLGLRPFARPGKCLRRRAPSPRFAQAEPPGFPKREEGPGVGP